MNRTELILWFLLALGWVILYFRWKKVSDLTDEAEETIVQALAFRGRTLQALMDTGEDDDDDEDEDEKDDENLTLVVMHPVTAVDESFELWD